MAVLVERRRGYVADGTWALYPLTLWSTAEISCGIICGCLPALPAFVRHMRGQDNTNHVQERRRHPSYPVTSGRRTEKEAIWTELDDVPLAKNDLPYGIEPRFTADHIKALEASSSGSVSTSLGINVDDVESANSPPITEHRMT